MKNILFGICATFLATCAYADNYSVVQTALGDINTPTIISLDNAQCPQVINNLQFVGVLNTFISVNASGAKRLTFFPVATTLSDNVAHIAYSNSSPSDMLKAGELTGKTRFLYADNQGDDIVMEVNYSLSTDLSSLTLTNITASCK